MVIQHSTHQIAYAYFLLQPSISRYHTLYNMAKETLRSAFPDKATPLVSYGLSFTDACVKHVDTIFNASRVYLIASASLTENTSHTSDLQNALGSKLVKTRIGMTSHTLMSEVLEIVHDARNLDADCIVTLGGGSISDGAKAISFVNQISHLSFIKRYTNTN